MNLESLKKISAARTPIKCQFIEPNIIDIDGFIYNVAREDAEFIACAANHFDQLLKIAEAANEYMTDNAGRVGYYHLAEALADLERVP